jgi:dTMP kinase
LFKNRKSDVVVTSEPGGTKVGKKFREILLESDEKLSVNAELLLFLTDRAEHFDKVVKPNILDKYVLSDRGLISGIAYALANHSNLDLNFLIELNKFALEGNLPNKVVLFQTDYELISSRLSKKEHDKIELRGIEYLLKVQEIMLEVIKALHVEYILIDSHKSIEEIYKKIEEFIYD